MKVLGLTTAQEFYIGSNERNFRINEYLVVEDKLQGPLIAEVMEANTYNRYMPLDIKGDLTDDEVLTSLSRLGYLVDDETIYIGKARLLNEASYPIETGSDVREPAFDEIKDFIINANIDNGLLIGSIKNTDNLYEDMDQELKDLYYTYDKGFEEQKDLPFLFNIEEMVQYPHIGVFGGSGSGKSYGLRVLLEELMKRRIPTIIFDPHYEMEFDIDESNPAAGRSYDSDYINFNIGQEVGVDFRDLNPGEFKKLLSAASPLTENMENNVDVIWREFQRPPDVNTFSNYLEDLVEMMSTEDSEIMAHIEGSSTEVKHKYERLLGYSSKYRNKLNESTIRGIAWRFRSIKNDGVFSNDSTKLIEELKTGKTCVISGSRRLLQVYGSYLLNKLYAARRSYIDHQDDYFPPFLVITDEAHEFAPKTFDSPTRSILREIAQEGRKYGVFLVFATQRPTLLDETITAQLNTKFIFRTVRGTDIQTLREETDISSEEAKRLPYLKTGDMFASVASIGRTLFTRVRAAETKKPHVKNPFDELKERKNHGQEDLIQAIDEYLPIESNDILVILKQLEKKDYSYGLDEFINKLDELVESGLLVKEEALFGDKYKRKE